MPSLMQQAMANTLQFFKFCSTR